MVSAAPVERPMPDAYTCRQRVRRELDMGKWVVALTLALAALAAPQARADAIADFYKGKQINLVVGYGPGGGYDVYARLLARHLGRHIPGQPSVVVQNMPGAGSLRAVNYLYNVAPRDGLTLAHFSRNMPLLGMLGSNPNAQFDPRRFVWLGSSSSFANDAYILIVRTDAPVKTIEDARRTGGEPLVLGGTAEGATGNDVPIILRDTIGLNVKRVVGYPDSGALYLAIERGEVHGRTTDLSSVKAVKPDWLKPNSGFQVLVQFARTTRHPEFPDVPTARELARSEKARALIELTELPYQLSRPFAAPPGVPADRAKALQAAFLATHQDSLYLDDAARLNVDVSPMGADDVMRALERIEQASPPLLTYLKKLFAESKG
jgi:tripartite-type tricarboxylate transporter receptor subunit TctC